MEQTAQPSFDFPAYLEAKFAIDSASLNASLYKRFLEHLRHNVNLRVLDLGTGTGAMLRRIVELELPGQVQLVGLDQEQQNLAAGVDRMVRLLRDLGFNAVGKQQSEEVRSICGKRGGSEVRIEFLRGDLLDRRTTDKLDPFDCITAHAFMDLMPLKRAVAVVRRLLKVDGLFYPTLNYDGLTVLIPEYRDAGFERRLLRIYNRSMEQRRNRGRKTGGALSGRRLYQALLEGGFSILGTGSSDWNVFPIGGAYTEEQKLFLTAILSMIEVEARRHSAAGSGTNVDAKLLAKWYADRLEEVQNHSLSLIVHQLDLLAKPA